jgi:flagellar protein FliL
MSNVDSEQAGKAKKSKLLVFIVGANVLLGGGAAAFFFLGAGSASSEASDASHEPDAAAKAAKAGAPIAEFQPIIVNLNEPEGTRYLKVTIAIQLVDDKVASEVDQLKPVITDAFIREMSELNFRQTMGSKNKGVIKRRLLKRFNEALGAERGVEVLFTEFVVQ